MSTQSIGVVITFHREGVFAHTTLRSYTLARAVARKSGLDVKFTLVLDGADEVTRQIVREHPDLDGTETLLEVTVGDAALARNAGIEPCDSDFICTLDGDDLISRNYFVEHFEQAAKLPEKAILHPEIVVSFGMYNAFNWQVDQAGPYFDEDSLLVINPWISAVFARRDIFAETPYAACFPSTTGFGYEDWYWNCETLAKGSEHRIAWGTIYFYRRKFSGSVNEASRSLRAVMPKTRLFDFARAGIAP